MTTTTTTTTTLVPLTGKVAALSVNGLLNVRNGSARTVAAMTAVMPGQSAARAAGAVVAFYPSYAAAAAAARKVTDGHDASDPASWSDGRWTVAVTPLADAATGKVDRDATLTALWLAAADVHAYLDAAARHAAPPTPRRRAARNR
jgi:hypothetical protein